MRNSFYKDKVLEGSKKWSLQIICLFFFTLVGVLMHVSNQRDFLIDSPYVTSEASKRDFCSAVMSQMIEKKLSPKLIDDGLYELISRDHYAALYLSGKEKIKGVWSADESCKILIHGETLRSFDFYLDDAGEYPFHYIVTKITEHDFFDKEGE